MNAFFEISGLNIYIQIAVTIISITVHLLVTRGKERKETTLDIISIYTIGLAGWFTISSGIFGHIIYADEVAASIGGRSTAVSRWNLHLQRSESGLSV